MQSHAEVVIMGGARMRVGLAQHLAEACWTELLLIEKGKRHRLTLLAEPAWDSLNEWQGAWHPPGD